VDDPVKSRTPAEISAGVARRLGWLRVLATAPRLAGGPRIAFGARTRVVITGAGELRRGRGVTIGDDFSAYIRAPVRLGTGVFINRWCYLSAFAGIDIGDRVQIGERVSFHDENHIYEPTDRVLGARGTYATAPIRIGDDVWIGANVVVTAGASIGTGTVVGANSVVRGELPDHVLAAGVPARVIRALDRGSDGQSRP
jgi:acetyltransferase-like isoleucine patch superfamily enzyme